MRRTVFSVALLATTLGLAGCQEPVTEAVPLAFEPQLARGGERGKPVEEAEFGLDREAYASWTLDITDQTLPEMAYRAIDPNDYVCPASTDMVDWFLADASRFIVAEPALFQLLYVDLLADLVVLYDALLFATDDTPQYFGYDGEYDNIMQLTDRDTRNFWDIDSESIQLIGMHGTVLLDEARVARVYQTVFGVDPATAAFFASLVAGGVASSQVLDGGNHSLFSFNAFATTRDGGKIIMGDGILAGYEALGFGDVAPQAIYAHEFAHHIQFQNGYFDDPIIAGLDAPEQTRYTELMADAMSAYYLTHARGQAMNKHRVAAFLVAFFQIGDCAFTNPGHHGTPNQRMRAAQFGFDVADQAADEGHILSSEAFHDLFVAEYPDLIAPDAI